MQNHYSIPKLFQNHILFQIILVIVFILPISLLSEEKVDITPKILALVRTKAEQNLSTENMNFMVRNARFGVKGKITNQLSYKIEIDWMDKEDMDMNDAKIIYTPIKDLDITLGQFKVPFSNDYQRNPADYSFANRTFITKRLAKNMRDVGVMLGYTLPIESMPIKLEFGIFNGNSSNSFEHDLQKAVSGKLSISPFSKSLFTLSGYKGQITTDIVKKTYETAEMIGASYTHQIGDFLIDVEAASKSYKDTINTNFWSVFGILSYNINIGGDLPIIKITPAIRYEIYNKTPDSKEESPRRLSLGLTFHLKEGNNSYFRLDYEKYNYKSGIRSNSDMLTLEYVIRI